MARDDGSTWCAHPHIIRGEILSSWLARFGHANGLSCHCFARSAFGCIPIWTRDIDRTATDELIALASRLPGASLTCLQASLIRRYEGKLFPPEFKGGTLPWITPAGVYHRTRRHHGSAYCPQCLREFGCAMLVWRLAWMVHCPRHEVPLRDACPRCDAPFVFHRITLADPRRYPCPACGYDLAHGGSEVRPVTMRARGMQRALTSSCAGKVRVIGGQRLTAWDFLDGLRFLLRGLYPKKRLGGLASGISSPIRTHLGVSQATSSSAFEHWRIQDRAVAMAYLAELIDHWPEKFKLAMRRGGVCPSRFGSGDVPGWIIPVLRPVVVRKRWGGG